MIDPDMDGSPLFTRCTVKGVTFANRFVMPGMQRGRCHEGHPHPHMPAYYRRRAEGGAALVITESCAVDHPLAAQNATSARLTQATRDSWGACVSAIHDGGARAFMQLWGEGGQVDQTGISLNPSGLCAEGRAGGRAATLAELGELRDAFARSAAMAREIGFDGIEVHACHGYLLDQFLWAATNRRDDIYGGETPAARARFPGEVVAAVRAAVGPDFPISMRLSQYKQMDYAAKPYATPDELSEVLAILRENGVDMFHASTREIAAPEWLGSDLGLAGWVKKLSGLPVIAVGGIGIEPAEDAASLADLARRIDDGEFDMVSIGRGHLADPAIVSKFRARDFGGIRRLTPADFMTLS